jgi:hypothetical protein
VTCTQHGTARHSTHQRLGQHPGQRRKCPSLLQAPSSCATLHTCLLTANAAHGDCTASAISLLTLFAGHTSAHQLLTLQKDHPSSHSRRSHLHASKFLPSTHVTPPTPFSCSPSTQVTPPHTHPVFLHTHIYLPCVSAHTAHREGVDVVLCHLECLPERLIQLLEVVSLCRSVSQTRGCGGCTQHRQVGLGVRSQQAAGH